MDRKPSGGGGVAGAGGNREEDNLTSYRMKYFKNVHVMTY